MNRTRFKTSSITALAIVFTFSTLQVWAGGSLSTGKIPDGYQAGRTDAKYGSYHSVVAPSARTLQARLLELQNKAHGLSRLSNTDEVVQSEAVFVLENELVKLFEDVGDASASDISDTERKILLSGSVHAYQIVRTQAERLTENMVRFIDEKFPGPNGQQIRQDSENFSTYSPNYRSDHSLSEAERQKLYEARLNSFISRGGSLNEIHTLSTEFVRSLGEYTRFEYVWLPNGEIQVTEGKAGHVLLSQGNSVKSAGQIVLIKTKNAMMLVVSNGSGNYKPDLSSAHELAEEIAHRFTIPFQYVSVTGGEPIGFQLTEIYLKGRGATPAQIQEAVERLSLAREQILNLNLSAGGIECALVFDLAA